MRERYEEPRGTTDDVWHGLADLGVLGLLAMAVTQIARGSLAVPATTALWYALQLLLETGRGQDRSLND